MSTVPLAGIGAHRVGATGLGLAFHRTRLPMAWSVPKPYANANENANTHTHTHTHHGTICVCVHVLCTHVGKGAAEPNRPKLNEINTQAI